MQNVPLLSQLDEENAMCNGNEKETEVTLKVTMTIEKVVKIVVDDYDVYEDYDDEGNINYEVDTDDCDFARHIEDQIEMPDGWEIMDTEWEKI